MLATLTSKGQLTVPKPIRDKLQLDAGTKLDFSIQPDGTISARPLKRSVASIFGLLHRPGQPAVSVEQMDQGIGEYLAAKHERILRTGTSEIPAGASKKATKRPR